MEATHVHHVARRRGGVADCGAGAARHDAGGPFDLVKESRTVGHDGRAALLPFEAIGFATQIDQRLEAENAALWRQLIVLLRQVCGLLVPTPQSHQIEF